MAIAASTADPLFCDMNALKNTQYHRCQHGREQMRDARISSLGTSIDAHTQTEIDPSLCQIALQ